MVLSLPGCLETKTPANSPSSAFTLFTANSISPVVDQYNEVENRYSRM